ncbi:MAG: hypothetical protein WCT08_03060 [Patescibacteria group bacterium]|jgi:hypothetical protein
MNFFGLKKKTHKGQTLLEAIIAIGVIMTGVIGSLVLVTTTIKLGRTNQDRVIAQNLAREGMELVYNLRNSATLMGIESPYISWDYFLYKKKSKAVLGYKEYYDIATGEGTESSPCVNAPDVSSNDNKLNDCDAIVIEKYLFEPPNILPPICEDYQYPVPGTPPYTTTPCDFNGDDKLNITDVVWLINYIYRNSYIMAYGGYPQILTTVAGSIKPYEKIDFNQDNSTLFFIGTDPLANIPAAWEAPTVDDPNLIEKRSRVYKYNNTYTQNVLPDTTPGLEKTKFYRMITLQSVCRGTHNGTPDTTVLLPVDSVLNCYDYVRTQVWNVADANTVKKVGILANVEVRWSTALSPTNVKYQEFIYDWINF